MSVHLRLRPLLSTSILLLIVFLTTTEASSTRQRSERNSPKSRSPSIKSSKSASQQSDRSQRGHSGRAGGSSVSSTSSGGSRKSGGRARGWPQSGHFTSVDGARCQWSRSDDGKNVKLDVSCSNPGSTNSPVTCSFEGQPGRSCGAAPRRQRSYWRDAVKKLKAVSPNPCGSPKEVSINPGGCADRSEQMLTRVKVGRSSAAGGRDDDAGDVVGGDANPQEFAQENCAEGWWSLCSMAAAAING